MKYILDDFFTKKIFWIHIFLPIFIGSLIYVLFRADNILIFKFFQFIGISEMINNIRNVTMEFSIYLPDWILFSLPDGLWVYSLNIFCLFFTGYYLDFKNCYFVIVGIFLGIGSELLQLINLIPGTFDIIDLIVCILSLSLAMFTYSISKKIYLKQFLKKQEKI